MNDKTKPYKNCKLFSVILIFNVVIKFKHFFSIIKQSSLFKNSVFSDSTGFWVFVGFTPEIWNNMVEWKGVK